MSEARSSVNVRAYQAADAASVSELIRTTIRASNASDYPLERLHPLIDYEAAARAESRERLEVKSSLTAVGFYERHGYRGAGETFDGTSGPQVPMHKLLA